MKVTQRLADALFDKTECMTCPFNSGTQRALFDTHVDDGHCTNATCFQLKTEVVEAARREAEAAAEAEDAAAAIGSNDGDEAALADDGDEIEDGGEIWQPDR
jgi:adenosine deaminase